MIAPAGAAESPAACDAGTDSGSTPDAGLRSGAPAESNGSWASGLRLPLPVGDERTVGRVRAAVGALLAVIGTDTETADDAQRCAAELLGNAVRHGREPVELVLHADGDTLVIGVVDGDQSLPSWPQAAAPPADAGALPELDGEDADLDALIQGLSTSGRGLELVRRFSAGHCGAHETRTRGGFPGKAVWFSPACPPPPDKQPESP